MSYTKEENKIAAQDQGIRLGDQLEEVDRLIGVLFESVKGLEAQLSPILRPLYEADGSEKVEEDISDSLSPVQQRVMSQYGMLNRLGNHLNGIGRRVQL